MDDSISLSFDIRKYNELAINARLLHRDSGPLKSVGFFLIPFSVAAGVGTLAGTMFLHMPWDRAVMPALYAGLGYFVAAMLLGLWHRGTLAKRVQQAPLRDLPYEVTLSAQGVNRGGRLYPWSVFTAVSVLPRMTVLQFSPAEGMPLPDKELPEGLTPDALRTQIDLWRKAAK